MLEASLHVAPSLDGWSVAYTQRQLARALRRAGRAEEALPLLEEALATLTGSHALLDAAATRLEQAKCLRALGRTVEALLALAAARAHFDVIGADSDVTECDETHAGWLHTEGRHAEAAKLNERLADHADAGIAYLATSRLADNQR